MADFKDVIDTLDKAADGFGNIANAEQKKIYEEVVTLAKDLETDVQGKVKQTITNLKRLNQIKAKLAALSKDKEWVAGIGKFVKYFDILQRQQNAYFSTAFPQLTLGESAKKRNEMMKQIAVNNTIEALMGDGLKANVTDKLNDILLRGVTSGAKWADLQQELRDHLMGKEGGQGAFARYATTYATTALSQYTGQHNQLLTKDLGLEWFMYVGSNIETTREFCEVLTKKKWIHKSEIPTILQGKIDMPDGEVVEVAIYEKTGLPKGMIADTTPDNFQCNCGGWNCRHQLIPVADAVVPKSVRDRIAFTAKEYPNEKKSVNTDSPLSIKQRTKGYIEPTIAQKKSLEDMAKKIGINLQHPMTREEANNGNENPKYGTETQYYVNCQTCTMVHLARRLGLNVEAVGNKRNSVYNYMKKHGFTWLERFLNADGTVPTYEKAHEWAIGEGKNINEINTIKEFIDKKTQADAIYEIYCSWKKKGAHVFCVERQNGKLRFFDPQNKEEGKIVEQYFERMKGNSVMIMRIDDKIINPKCYGLFLKK